jgi:hypothetical protein
MAKTPKGNGNRAFTGDPPGYQRTNLPTGTYPNTPISPSKPDASGRLPEGAPPRLGAVTANDEAWVEWELAQELGATGLKQWSGIVREELLPKLMGSQGLKVYQEMSDNNPIIKASLQAIDLTVRQVKWRVEAPGPKAEDKEATAYVESIKEDMAHTWPDHISEAMTMLPFGYSLFEIVYKKRNGPTKDPHTSSRFDDGRIGVRKLAIRAQDSLYRWQFDATGGIQGMIQRPPPDYWERAIPIDKALLYRTTIRKGNPEGVSILRGAYRPWFFSKRIEEIQGVGVERDLAGLPVAFVPPSIMGANASAADKAVYERVKKIVVNIRNDDQAGIVMPQVYDAAGHKLFDLTLMTSGGRRNFDTSAILTYYDQRIAMSMMTDFLLLGHAAVGTYSLGESKMGVFSTAISTYLDSIADVLNRYLVPRLFALNGWTLDKLPTFVHEPVESVDLIQMGNYIGALAKSGMSLFPNPELEEYLKRAARLPSAPAPETAEQAREQDAAPETPGTPPPTGPAQDAQRTLDAGARGAGGKPADAGAPPAGDTGGGVAGAKRPAAPAAKSVAKGGSDDALPFSDAQVVKYSPDQPRDESGRFGSGGTSGERTGGSKRERAIASHKPSTAAKQRIGDRQQRAVARGIGGAVTPDNAPMDVTLKVDGRNVGVEVKTFVDQKNNKVTVHPESGARKASWGRREKASRSILVVVDARQGSLYSGNRYYVADGVRSYRLSSMTPMRTMADVRAYVHGGRR